MSDEKFGIEELKKLSTFLLKLVNAMDASLKDGKLELSDMTHFGEAMFAAFPALSGIKDADDEYFDLSDAEKEELKAHIASELQLDPSHQMIENIIESVLGLLLDFKELLKSMIKPENA